jgi:hypothetical protein
VYPAAMPVVVAVQSKAHQAVSPSDAEYIQDFIVPLEAITQLPPKNFQNVHINHILGQLDDIVNIHLGQTIRSYSFLPVQSTGLYYPI